MYLYFTFPEPLPEPLPEPEVLSQVMLIPLRLAEVVCVVGTFSPPPLNNDRISLFATVPFDPIVLTPTLLISDKKSVPSSSLYKYKNSSNAFFPWNVLPFRFLRILNILFKLLTATNPSKSSTAVST